MDRLLIQAAFMSLDDIDKEENKKVKEALLESRLNEKKKRSCCIDNPNPTANVDSFNHATDIGASSPSTGLGEEFDDDELWDSFFYKTIVVKDNNKRYGGEKGKIINLVDGNGGFNDSIWKVALDKGIITEIKGNELIVNDSDTIEEAKESISKEDSLKEIRRLKSLVKSGSLFTEDYTKTKFNLKDPEEVEEAKEVTNQEVKEDNTLVAVDPSIETVDEDKEPHIGDALLQCNTCKTIITCKVEDLVPSEEDEKVYNIDDTCPHCGAQEGYSYIAQLSSPNSEDAKKAVEENPTNEEKPAENEKTTTDELEPIEDENEPEEIIEESFDNLVNKYLNKVYEGINLYKTSDIKQVDRNKYILEGYFYLPNKKRAKTHFILEQVKENNNKLLFRGSNTNLLENKVPYSFIGNIKDKKLIFESLRYRYKETIDNKEYLVEGIQKNK